MNPDFTITESGDRIRFRVRVTPRAARAGVGGIREGALLVRVTAPPADEAANVAVRRLLADLLRVPFTLVVIAAGRASRSKTVTAPAAAAAVLRSLADRPTGG